MASVIFDAATGLKVPLALAAPTMLTFDQASGKIRPLADFIAAPNGPPLLLDANGGSTKTYAQAGGTPIPIYPQFLPTDKLMVFGDSRVGQEIVGASPGTLVDYNSSVGPFAMALAVSPVMLMEQWPADTSARDAPQGTMWTDGANMGISGSPWTKHRDLVPTIITRAPKAVYYAYTPNSLVDATAAQGVVDQILTPLKNAGIFIIIGGMPPIMAGSGLDPGSSTYAARYSDFKAKALAFVAANGPSKSLYYDQEAWCPVDSNGYATNGDQFRDGVHFNGKGTLDQINYTTGSIFPLIATGNRLVGLYTSVANRLPNPTLSGTGGTRSGTTISYATSLSVPNNWRVSAVGTIVSTATAGLETNPETGGQSAVLTITGPNTAAGAVGTGSISVSGSAPNQVTTLTLTNVATGAFEVGQRLDMPGILPGTIIIAGSGLSWTLNKAQTVSSGTVNAFRIKEGINIAPSSGVSTGAVVDASLSGLFTAAFCQVELSDHPGWIPPQILLNDNTTTGNIRGGNYWQVLYNDGKSDTKGRTWWCWANAIQVDGSAPATTGFRWNVSVFFDPTILPAGATAKIKRVWAGVVGDPKARFNAL